MAISVEAVYENGVLGPVQPLPLKDQDRVRLTIEPAFSWADRSYGLLGWTGDAATVEYFALSPDLDPEEDP
jgi:predicted DNA-binding antitoxin AbrB/MazE fold protein